MLESKNVITRQQLVIALLIAVFSLPFAGAWIVYYFTDYGETAGSNSYGELIVPPRPLPDMELQNTDPAGADGQMRGRWNLIYLISGDCGMACRRTLEGLRAVRQLLDRNAGRLQLVVAGAGLRDANPAQAAALHGFYFLRPESHELFEELPAAEEGLLLIDPLGNLMMRYPANSDPVGITWDLKRLLRYSRVG